jgi:hypothetical protein
VSLFLLSGGPFVRRSAAAANEAAGTRSEGDRSADIHRAEPHAIAAPVASAIPMPGDCRTLARGGFGQLGDTFGAPGRPPLPVPT